MFFLLGLPLWFLAIEIVFLVSIVTLVENERGSLAGVVLAAFVAGTFWLTGTNPINFLYENGNLLFFGAIAYLVLGVLWSIVKWVFYLHSDYYAAKVKLSHDNWVNYLKGSYADKNMSYIDYIKKEDLSFYSVSTNKIKVTRWMIWWPVSLAWTILDDLVINIFNWLYELFSGIYSSLANNRINKLTSEFAPKAPVDNSTKAS